MAIAFIKLVVVSLLSLAVFPFSLLAQINVNELGGPSRDQFSREVILQPLDYSSLDLEKDVHILPEIIKKLYPETTNYREEELKIWFLKKFYYFYTDSSTTSTDINWSNGGGPRIDESRAKFTARSFFYRMSSLSMELPGGDRRSAVFETVEFGGAYTDISVKGLGATLDKGSGLMTYDEAKKGTELSMKAFSLGLDAEMALGYVLIPNLKVRVEVKDESGSSREINKPTALYARAVDNLRLATLAYQAIEFKKKGWDESQRKNNIETLIKFVLKRYRNISFDENTALTIDHVIGFAKVFIEKFSKNYLLAYSNGILQTQPHMGNWGLAGQFLDYGSTKFDVSTPADGEAIKGSFDRSFKQLLWLLGLKPSDRIDWRRRTGSTQVPILMPFTEPHKLFVVDAVAGLTEEGKAEIVKKLVESYERQVCSSSLTKH